ncbi:MAG: hypothetical protein JNM56_17620, partial [Planctomycetia bacterium]|nr:hypothetical protein [Planctomycetia bacterium]
MSRCSHYQSHALDHLYGLLDAEESLTLIEHVGQCEDCRAALLKADLHKKLLTAASKPEFAGVRFDVPSEQELQTVRFPSRPAAVRQLNWRRYAAAAAILLAVSAVGIPSSIYLFGQHQANQAYVQAHKELDELARKERQLIKDQDALLVRAGDDYKAAQRALTNLETDQAKALNTAHDAIFKNNMVMVVKGPEAVRLGEETTYVIETRAFDTKAGPGKPVPVKLDAVVRDQTTNRVVFEQKGIASQGVTQLVLAPEVTLKGGSGLALELVAHGADGVRGELTERLALARASYVTHLYTDKPIYQPGETVRWRSLTLDRFTLKPAAEELRLQIKLTGPLGNKILETEHAARIVDTVGREWLGPDKKPLRGIAAGEWQIPTDFSGGDYFLEVKDAVGRFPTERRKFVVNKYQAPRLNKEVKFDKESYGPRGTVTASVKVARAEGGAPVANRDVFAVVQIDGKFYNARGEQVNDEDAAKIRATTDETGAATIRYTLPAEMDKGDATLGLQFNDGANFEAMSRPFNVVVNKLQLEFFPEGGDLIAGVPNRIYFQARTMLDKPATVGKAVLVDETGKVVADNLATLNHPVGKDEPALNQGLNQGMGKFAFTPQAGKKYALKVVEPAGIKAQFALPAVVSDGVALQVPSAVTSEQEPIKIEVRSAGKDRELLVGAYCRGRLLGFHELTAKNGQAASLSIKPAKDVGGVYRVTVFEKLAAGNGRQQLKPVAERLVYRMPAERLNLWVKYPDDHSQRVFAPGTKVNLQLLANSETGSPAPAVVLVGIVDKSVIKMADERTARAMPTHFLLTSEVRRAEDLEFADILLSDHAQATEALDLLLGTQGWRRFLESDPSRMPGKNQPLNAEEMRCNAADVDRLLVALGKSSIDQQRASDTFALRQQQIIDSFGPKFENVQAQLLQTAETLENAREGREFDVQKNGLRDQTDQARAASIAALTKLRQYDDWNATIRSRLLLAFGLILLLAGAGSLLVG